MTTFKYIIQKIMNMDNNIFSLDYNNADPVNPIYKTFFSIIYTMDYSIKNKFKYYHEIQTNLFLKDNQKEVVENYFCMIQKTYIGFQRLAYLYKYKKCKTVVDTDMGLNTIRQNDKNIISICQNDSIYLFNILDLIKIIDTSLTNSHMFFSEPLTIKNPYNNLCLNKSTLYNIYFYIKFNTHIYADLFFKFFQTNFNLHIFSTKYEYLLREYSIENYVNKSPTNILCKEITRMINNFNKNYINDKQKIIIEDDFPKDRLIKIMKPYLLLSFTSIYSLITIDRDRLKLQLKQKLLAFKRFNPLFGRKMIKMGYKYYINFERRKYMVGFQYNDKHIVFDETESNFLSSHSNIPEDFYEEEEDEEDEVNGEEDEVDGEEDEVEVENNNNNTVNVIEYYDAEEEEEEMNVILNENIDNNIDDIQESELDDDESEEDDDNSVS